MAMLNSYVKLPEGMCIYIYSIYQIHSDPIGFRSMNSMLDDLIRSTFRRRFGQMFFVDVWIVLIENNIVVEFTSLFF